MSQVWRKCGVCKKDILLNQAYQKCSVSSCKKHAFCSVDCWSVHDSYLGHKSAWAEEHKAPAVLEEERPKRRIIVQPSKPSNSSVPKDVLIVVSKLKSYIKAKGDMNTSGDVADVLSDIVRDYVDKAMEEARLEGRKTVMGRDFKL